MRQIVNFTASLVKIDMEDKENFTLFQYYTEDKYTKTWFNTSTLMTNQRKKIIAIFKVKNIK